MNIELEEPGYDPFETTLLGKAIFEKNVPDIQTLLAHPEINVNAHNGLALREAVHGGDYNIVDMLVEAGADPRTDNSMALALAVRSDAPNPDIAMRLIEGGADPARITPSMLESWSDELKESCAYGLLQQYAGPEPEAAPENSQELAVAARACIPSAGPQI